MSTEKQGIPVEETRSEVAAQAASPETRPFTNDEVRQSNFKLYLENTPSLLDHTTYLDVDNASKNMFIKFKLKRELDVLAYLDLTINKTISAIFEFGSLKFKVTLMTTEIAPVRFTSASENSLEGEVNVKIIEFLPLQKIEPTETKEN